jgi:predicted phosphohydrolase
MRLWILSDLHLEAHPEIELPLVDADVAIVASDVHRPLWKAVRWLADNVAPLMPVVYVPGNHEFHGGSVEGCMKRGLSAAAAVDDVFLLNDSEVVIGGIRFLGGTMWTDYALDADPEPGRRRDFDIGYAMNECGSNLSDHIEIYTDDSMTVRWQPEHAREGHMCTRRFLSEALAVPFPGPTIVVTHHAPHPCSIDKGYDGSPVNPAFASNLSELIVEGRPNLWVHGHVHDPVHYCIGETLVICNPRGYQHEGANGFNPALLVTVPGW